MIPSSASHGIRGLHNDSTTCYLNSVIQVLAHIPGLRNFLMDLPGNWGTPSDSMEHKVLKAFCQFLDDQWRSPDSTAFFPMALLSAMQDSNAAFSIHDQQDSEEFLNALLNLLNKELSFEKPDFNWDRRVSRSLRVPEESVVSCIFKSKTRSGILCGSCHHESVTFDKSFEVQLCFPEEGEVPPPIGFAGFENVPMPPLGKAVPPAAGGKTLGGPLSLGRKLISSVSSLRNSLNKQDSVSLEVCLRKLVAPEKLDQENQYFCETCQEKRDSIKQTSFWELPDVMYLHVKRFSYGHRNCYKSHTSIGFSASEPVNLGSLLHPSAPAFGQSHMFALRGLLVHFGSSDNGHYISFCRHAETDGWYEFDDARVRPVSPDVVEKAEPYVLFYERLPSESVMARHRHFLSQALAFPQLKLTYVPKDWLYKFLNLHNWEWFNPEDYLCPHGKVGARCLDPLMDRLIPIDAEFAQLIGLPRTLENPEVCGQCLQIMDAYEDLRVDESRVMRDYADAVGRFNPFYFVPSVWASKFDMSRYSPTMVEQINEIHACGPLNSNWFFRSPGVLKPNLEATRDYCTCSFECFQGLKEIHGLNGEPLIREEPDIYSEPVEVPLTHEPAHRFYDLCD